MATGLGKTQVFSEVARRWDGDILVLAHRAELIEQAKQRLEQMTGEWVDVEKSWQRAGTARIVVGSVDTVKNRKRLESFGPDRFSLIIVDECHHYAARTYKRPLEFFSTAKILGVTATPDRGDSKALGAIFESVCYTMDIQEGIDAGYLVPIKGRRVLIDSIDLSSIKTYMGDFAVGQLDNAMLKGVEGIVNQTLKLAPDRKGLAFFPGLASAEYAAERFNMLKPGSACFISGKTDDKERDQIVSDFKSGKYQYLCNCQIATEGFDDPAVNLIIQGRPTKVRAFYTQTVGRGTRVLPGVIEGQGDAAARRTAIASSAKPDCTILDFVGNSGKHCLVSPVDLLGGDYDDSEIQLAKKMEEEDEESDPKDLLEEARTTLRQMARAVQSQVSARNREFDPFAILHVRYDDSVKLSYGDKPASDKQKAYLIRVGMDKAYVNSLSSKEASKLTGTLHIRRKLKRATYKQTKMLRDYGIDDEKVGIKTASKAIDYILSNKSRGRVDREVVHKIVYKEK
jgi:superfamily II DNA or RNA helicase